ncbi:hypothetical protein Tco_0885770 [Tanacetum coccineum]
MHEVILFYNGLEVQTRQILDSRGVIPFLSTAHAKIDVLFYNGLEVQTFKVPLILERLFLSTAHAKIDVFKRKITLRVGEERIIFKSVKPASSLIKRVYMLILRKRMELDLDVRRDQVDDLMPTIEEGKVIEEVKASNDARMVSKIFGYPSDYDQREKIRIDYAYNLKFSCMIGFKFIHANFLPNLPINVMSKSFYYSIMKDKIEFKGRNELGNKANIPIFIGNFCVLTSFAIVENVDPYVEEGKGDVVDGKPFCKVSCVETKRFDGIITIHGEDESVTYQMVRTHLRFKRHTNEQCNKIPPLLKVSEEDKMNGISHSYQKQKRFYQKQKEVSTKAF